MFLPFRPLLEKASRPLLTCSAIRLRRLLFLRLCTLQIKIQVEGSILIAPDFISVTLTCFLRDMLGALTIGDLLSAEYRRTLRAIVPKALS